MILLKTHQCELVDTNNKLLLLNDRGRQSFQRYNVGRKSRSLTTGWESSQGTKRHSRIFIMKATWRPQSSSTLLNISLRIRSRLLGSSQWNNDMQWYHKYIRERSMPQAISCSTARIRGNDKRMLTSLEALRVYEETSNTLMPTSERESESRIFLCEGRVDVDGLTAGNLSPSISSSRVITSFQFISHSYY